MEETDRSSVVGASSARVFATRGLDVRKAPDSPKRFKRQFQPNRSRGKKVTAISKRALEIALPAESADMDQTATKNRLIFWPSPSGERTQKESPTSRFFFTSGAGRFRRRLAHMKINISDFLMLVWHFPSRWVLFFYFLSKTENTIFL